MVLQAKSLFKKISSEADNLKSLWVAKLNLRGKQEVASEEDLQAYEMMKVEVMVVYSIVKKSSVTLKQLVL